MEAIFWTYLFVILIVNAGFSAIVAYVATQKGRSASGFFWLSFFLSFLVGILVVLAIPKVDKAPQAINPNSNFASSAEGKLFKCPYCAEWVKSEARVCRYCGKDIADDVKKFSEAEKAQSEKLRLEAAAEAARTEAERQEALKISKEKRREFFKKPLVRILGLAGVVVLVGGIAAGFIAKASADSAFEAAHSDWATLVKECGSLPDGATVTVSPSNDRIEVIGIEGHYIDASWTKCLGESLAMNPEKDKGTLGSWMSYKAAMEGSPVKIKYGNLRAVVSYEDTGEDRNWGFVITKAKP
jgi:hypothetical protein